MIKRILILIMLCVLVYVIYVTGYKKYTNTFGIGTDGNYTYNIEDMRITDIKMAILRNDKINDKYIQNILVKSTNIIINMNSFKVPNSYENAYNMIKDIEELIKIIRQYSKEKITIMLYDNSREIEKYMNTKISMLCEKYGIMYSR